MAYSGPAPFGVLEDDLQPGPQPTSSSTSKCIGDDLTNSGEDIAPIRKASRPGISDGAAEENDQTAAMSARQPVLPPEVLSSLHLLLRCLHRLRLPTSAFLHLHPGRTI